MRYCKTCILPDSRPGLVLDAEGICSACRAHQQRPAIDWDKRQKAFKELVATTKALKRRYDCIIPVSGGKDSTWQVILCLEAGLHPLAVTWKSPGRTPLGEQNLANLIRLGVDHIDYQVNPKVEKKFVYRALAERGAPALPMHMALFNIPVRIAVDFKVPLLVWGENSATEYAGQKGDETARLDSQWLSRYGVTDGTTAKDWVSPTLSAQELTPYFGPTETEMQHAGLQGVFLGSFFSWDPLTTLKVAQTHGFQVRQEGPKTGYYNYADIDDDFISVHHFLKWYKFGFTRLFDNLSLEIRNGRMTRDQAIQIVREKGDQTPHADIETFCRFLEISKDHFFELVERFRNTELWIKQNGRWVIPHFLISGWTWS